MKKEKNNKKKIILNLIICFLLTMTLTFSLIRICKWNKENRDNENIIENIKDTAVVKDENQEEKYIVDFDILKEQNNDSVAWIKIEGTNIDYPVVKSNNNDFYLNHGFDKKVSSAGWIFADYRNKFDDTDKNIIIYGHNRRDGSMFQNLKQMLNSKWYDDKDNKNIIFYNENGNYTYEIFSVYQIETEDYYLKTNFNSEDEFKKFIETLKKRSIKDFNVDISNIENILTLSTCANNNRDRIVIHAKKLVEGE